MEAMIRNQILVNIPLSDLDVFTRLARQFQWITMPVQSQSTQLTDEELYRLADEISSAMNHDAPKMTMEEIVQEVRDYRNGK